MPDDAPQMIRVRCVACAGTGVAAASADHGSPSATVRICPACLGQKMIDVRPEDPRWRFSFSDKGAPVVTVSHVGTVTLGEPMPDADVLSLADYLPNGSAMGEPAKAGHLVSCFLLLASELSKTRRELAATRALAERLSKDVTEARIDAAAVRLELRRRLGPEPEEAA